MRVGWVGGGYLDRVTALLHASAREGEGAGVGVVGEVPPDSVIDAYLQVVGFLQQPLQVDDGGPDRGRGVGGDTRRGEPGGDAGRGVGAGLVPRASMRPWNSSAVRAATPVVCGADIEVPERYSLESGGAPKAPSFEALGFAGVRPSW